MVSPEAIMRLAPVIPVLTIHDVAHARPIAEALVAGGLRALEVTLRTPAALEALSEMAGVEDAVVGAGTVLGASDLESSLRAGAKFIVSPGLTEPLVRGAIDAGVPFLPGASTASDLMRGLDFGLTHFKFFPAEAAGGRQALAALSAPFSHVRFCPTGGITPGTASEWLDLPSVLCVGGSWLVPAGDPDSATIRARAAMAAGLRRSS